jgi:predicted transcriptional regulator
MERSFQDDLRLDIKRRMEVFDVPLKALALKSGVHVSTISRFTNGVKDFNVNQLVKVIEALGHFREEFARREVQRLRAT